MKKHKKILLHIAFLSFLFFINCSSQNKKKNEFGLVIHGGAGHITEENTPPEKAAKYKKELNNALQTGYALLEKGKTSMDVVEAVIMILEDSPLFNAGKGAVFNNKGKFELDASIMHGKTLNAGAIAGVKYVKNPIKAARMVMDKSSHVLLAGAGADEFAKENNMEIVPNEYFMTEKRKKQWEKIKNEGDQKKVEAQEIEKNGKFGTVGVVALDKNGNLAAGTSTGGMTMKKFGRVGDSPIIGAGTYANNKTCAVSCTGHGEFFIRYAVAHDISALMEYQKMSLKSAAELVINKKLKSVDGSGGVIGIDAEGNIAMKFNTPGMYRGYFIEGGEPVVKMFKD